jgi:FKBP-type peptidyl-prolyl cis-trans isomerase (trigger factor)
MVSQRELQEVVTQINVILERLDKRLQLVESTQNSLLHELKEDMKKEAKKRVKNG